MKASTLWKTCFRASKIQFVHVPLSCLVGIIASVLKTLRYCINPQRETRVRLSEKLFVLINTMWKSTAEQTRSRRPTPAVSVESRKRHTFRSKRVDDWSLRFRVASMVSHIVVTNIISNHEYEMWRPPQPPHTSSRIVSWTIRRLSRCYIYMQ